MTIITLPELEMSRGQAARSKTWIKRVDRVDTTSTNGYAFVGPFEAFGRTVEATDGTHFMSYIDDCTGSGHVRSRQVTLYRVQLGSLVEIETWKLPTDDRGWALHVRDAIHTHMVAPATPDEPDEPNVDALLAERETLLARIAEIDAILPAPADMTVDARRAAELLGVSLRTVYRWATTGKVAAEKDASGRWVITITAP